MPTIKTPALDLIKPLRTKGRLRVRLICTDAEIYEKGIPEGGDPGSAKREGHYPLVGLIRYDNEKSEMLEHWQANGDAGITYDLNIRHMWDLENYEEGEESWLVGKGIEG